MDTQRNLDIYYDGNCSFCRWSKGVIEPWDTRGRLRFLDINDPEVAAATPYPREKLLREMHLREPDGTWSAGFAAWVRILGVLPRWAWLGRLLGLAPFRWLGAIVYRWVARHRHLLPGAPPVCTAETCAPTGTPISTSIRTPRRRVT